MAESLKNSPGGSKTPNFFQFKRVGGDGKRLDEKPLEIENTKPKR